MKSIAIPFLDHLLAEFKSRFENRAVISMVQLVPQQLSASNNEVDITQLQFWKDDLPNPNMLQVRNLYNRKFKYL